MRGELIECPYCPCRFFTQTDFEGRARAGGFVLKTAGTQTITVEDGGISDTTEDIDVDPA